MPRSNISTRRRPVCIISEGLSPPLDEGIRNFAHSLLESWPPEHPVMGLSVRSRWKTGTPNAMSVMSNKLLLNFRVWAEIRRFRPCLLCYVPSASATLFSFLRGKVLRFYRPGARVVIVCLQPRCYGWISRHLMRVLSPDVVFVQDDMMMRRLAALGCPARLLPSGVNLEKFTPVLPQRKAELREKYGLKQGIFTVLHVGHVKRGRNVEFLARVHRDQGAQVVLVGSTLPDQDRGLAAHLREQGVVVLSRYLPHIEELYQLSDCYLFPVLSDQDSIGIPLSVLEAMACNLPVATLRFGGLPSMFEPGEGLLFADTPEGLLQSVAQAGLLDGCHTRRKVAPYSWQNVARGLMNQSGLGEARL